MDFKLGKTPARKDAVKLKFGTYLAKKLPKAPKKGGHMELMRGQKWGMLGNDMYGCCVWSGAAHETMLWNTEAQHGTAFVQGNILNDYAIVTGFNPSDPSTDKGTDMQVAASFRLKTGIQDAQNTRHKIGAYLALDLKKEEEIRLAIHYFSAAGIGIEFPESAMQQFHDDKDWTVIKGAKVAGGHYIPALAYDEKFVYIVSWGKLIRATWAFINKYMDEGLVYLSEEMLRNGVSLEGFNMEQLQKDLAAITAK